MFRKLVTTDPRLLVVAAYLLIFGQLLLVTGCSNLPPDRQPSVELLVGHKVGDPSEFIGDDPTGTVRIKQPVSDRAFIEYEHVSHIFDGWPFNNDAEDQLDQINFGIKLGGSE